jgi:hypothetical protein
MRSASQLPPQQPKVRMANYRQRMQEAGLKPVQILLPDTKSPDFIDKCRKQTLLIAQHDPAGDEALEFIEAVYSKLEL